MTSEEREEWESRTSFLTPVAKAYGSDISFWVTETALQVYGGYGYTKDYTVEQFLRDEKVHSIFEGTNDIQALDLAGRRVTVLVLAQSKAAAIKQADSAALDINENAF